MRAEFLTSGISHLAEIGYLVEHKPVVGVLLKQVHAGQDVRQSHLQIFLARLKPRPPNGYVGPAKRFLCFHFRKTASKCPPPASVLKNTPTYMAAYNGFKFSLPFEELP